MRRILSEIKVEKYKEEFIPIELTSKLVNLLDGEIDQLDILWGLSNIASLSTLAVDKLFSLKIHIKALTIMQDCSDSIKEQCLWLIANMSGDSNKRINEFLCTNLTNQLITIIEKGITNPIILENICWIISNLSKSRPPPPFDKVYSN